MTKWNIQNQNNFSRFVEKETSIRNIDFEEIFLIIFNSQEIKQFQIFKCGIK